MHLNLTEFRIAFSDFQATTISGNTATRINTYDDNGNGAFDRSQVIFTVSKVDKKLHTKFGRFGEIHHHPKLNATYVVNDNAALMQGEA